MKYVDDLNQSACLKFAILHPNQSPKLVER